MQPRVTALLKVSVLAGTALATMPALAQTTATAGSEVAVPGAAVEDIVVTGSRIARSGFTTPTPTTVLGIEDLNKRGFTNIGQIASIIPAFEATTTPASTNLTSNRAGGSYLNLRGLGDNRTLILVDSRRFVPTNTESSVDTNVIPSVLVERVEVVTGGASAAYGSDAVAGVVNIILKNDLEGVLGSAQSGISTRGDDATYKASLGYGVKLGDRGHFEIAGEGEKNEGIGLQSTRGWASHNYALVGNPNAASPANIIVPNVQFAIETPGGLVRSGPFRGTQFAPGGAPIPLTGGAGDGFYQIGGNGVGVGDYVSLSVPYKRYSGFTKADYDLGGGVTAFFEASYSHSEGQANVLPASNFGSIAIQQDNAYLNPGLRAQLLAAGQTSFLLSRYSVDFGLLTSNVANDTVRAVGGFEGSFGASWKWNAYGQFGDTISNIDRGNTANLALFNKSADAVIGPAGTPICRVNLTPGNPAADPSCVPVNLFGFGSPSRAALNYFLGTSKFRANIHQYVGAGSVTGDLFAIDGKPLAVAFGVEYRNDQVVGTADPISQVNGFTFGNPKSIAGSRDVIEGFAEVAVPLLHDRPFVKALDLDGAVRVTNYTGSGTVETWKASASWAIDDNIRLRATRSRDIRAANLSELYQTSNTLFATVRDPAKGGANTTITQVTGGNPLLRPEEADTLTAGVVLTPTFVPGVRLSADYYDIKINGAVATLAAQDLINRCFAGNADLCRFITRDSTGALTGINVTNVNVAQVATRGVDLEGSYTRAIGEGVVSLRGLATYVDRLTTSNGGISINRAGEVGPNNNGLPHWRFDLNLTYSQGPVTLFVENRFIGAGKYDNSYTAADIDNNHIRAADYVNLGVQFDIFHSQPGRAQFFVNANNVFDSPPPVAPSSFFAPPQTNAILYDVIGTFVTSGVRFRF